MMAKVKFTFGLIKFFEGEDKYHCISQAEDFADENDIKIKEIDFGKEIDKEQ